MLENRSSFGLLKFFTILACSQFLPIKLDGKNSMEWPKLAQTEQPWCWFQEQNTLAKLELTSLETRDDTWPLDGMYRRRNLISSPRWLMTMDDLLIRVFTQYFKKFSCFLLSFV